MTPKEIVIRELIEVQTGRLVDAFRGGFIAKDYSDLHGIGVDLEWDTWAYDVFAASGQMRLRPVTPLIALIAAPPSTRRVRVASGIYLLPLALLLACSTRLPPYRRPEWLPS